MPITNEDAFKLIRDSVDLIEKALADPVSGLMDGQIRMAYYNLYQAANVATLISSSGARLFDGGNDEYQLFVDILYRRYYRDGKYPREGIQEEFDVWRNNVQRYVNKILERSSIFGTKKKKWK